MNTDSKTEDPNLYYNHILSLCEEAATKLGRFQKQDAQQYLALVSAGEDSYKAQKICDAENKAAITSLDVALTVALDMLAKTPYDAAADYKDYLSEQPTGDEQEPEYLQMGVWF